MIGRTVASGMLATVMWVGGLVPAEAAVSPSVPEVEDRTDQGVTADVLPTVQIDSGVVWDQAIVGNVVFAGGQFTQTRPAGANAGQQLTPRSNLLAYDLTTGNLLPFAPQVNGAVKAVKASPDGTRLYVGGSFTHVNGYPRANLAAFDVASGALLDTFQSRVGGSFVNALAVTDSHVYVGGLFSQANGASRANMAAFDHAGNLTGWAPSADRQVDSLLAMPDGRIIAAGRFGNVNRANSRGTASLHGTTGASLPWELPRTSGSGIVNGGTNAAGTMGLSTDGTLVYGAAWQHASENASNIEGLWAAEATTGKLAWMTAGKGDHYDVAVVNGLAYGVGHSHEASGFGGWPDKQTPGGLHQNSIVVTADARGTNGSGSYWSNSGKLAPALIQWYPNWITGSFTGMGQAGWTVEGNGDYIAIGGEFIGVNGARQQGLARFAKPGIAPAKIGPRFAATRTTQFDQWEKPTLLSRPGGVIVSIPPNYDRDDRTLTYELYREGRKEPVARTRFTSDLWRRTTQAVKLADFSGAGGTTYTYTVKAIDRDGNFAMSAPVQGVAGAGQGQATSRYSMAVLEDSPSLYWRLGGPNAMAGVDWAGTNNASIGSGVSEAPNGAVVGDPGTGSRFDGSSTGRMGTSATTQNPETFSSEVWFKTTTTSGGKLTGYMQGSSGTAGANDRHVYMRNDGRLTFGVYRHNTYVIDSPAAYNDGAWHHVVATLDQSGMQLYVDGERVAERTSPAASSEFYSGFWQVGGSALGTGWPGYPSSRYFKGDLDEFAVYSRALTAAQVKAHYVAATDAEIAPPLAAFSTTVSAQRVSFDASDSKALGTKAIAAYRWDFGDGTTGIGKTVAHSYPTAGPRTVTLTVVDSKGLISTLQREITVHTPYSSQVLADGASWYWSLGAGAGATNDLAGSNHSATYTGISPEPDAIVPGDFPQAMVINQSTSGLATTSSVTAPTTNFSQEVWFKTTSTKGGLLLGYARNQRGTAGGNDRNLAMNNAGQLFYAVYPGANRIITSPASYNDGQWHHAVTTLGSTGQILYVDGVQVAQHSTTTSAENASGYWRVGYGPIWGGTAASNAFAGRLDEVAVYGTSLTAQQVKAHYELGQTKLPEPEPEPGPEPGTVLVNDTFTRTGASWGNTDDGYAWTSVPGMTVADGHGVIAMPTVGEDRAAWLAEPLVRDLDLTADFAFDKAAAGGSSFLTTAIRHTDAGDYRAKVYLGTNQVLTVNLERVVGTTTTTLASTYLRGEKYTPGQQIHLRLKATSEGTTTSLAASLWPEGTPTPETWTVTATDTTAALAVPGQIGLIGYLGRAATNVPQTMRVDSLRVVTP